jgi:hypothetical protein
VNGVRQVRRWSDSGKGDFIDMAAGPYTIKEILGLQSGSMLVALNKGFEYTNQAGRVRNRKKPRYCARHAAFHARDRVERAPIRSAWA